MLSRAYTRGRLHHGLLVTGPRGVGKTTFALGLGCALLCEVEPAVGCGSCATCRRVLEGNHTDVRHIVGEGKSGMIKIDVARQVAIAAQHAPYEGKAHLIIFDPADALNEPAANSLLKTIEEPRDGVHFVLLARNASAVIQTLVSRCIQIPLARVSDADVQRVFEGTQIEPKRRALAVHLSQGCPGVALALATDPSLEACEQLLAQAIRAANAGPSTIFGGPKSALWGAWDEAIAQLDDGPTEPEEPDAVVVVKHSGKKPRAKKKAKKKKASRRSETPAKQRALATLMGQLWLLHLRDHLRGATGIDGVPAPAQPPERLSAAVSRVQRFTDSMLRNPNVRLALEQTLLDIHRL